MNFEDQGEAWRLLELCERAMDGRLTTEEQQCLETLLNESEQARALFARALHQNAELRYDQRLINELRSPHQADSEISTRPSMATRWRWLGYAAAACVAVGLSSFFLARIGQSGDVLPLSVATLEKSINTKWASSTLPTAQGSRIAAGRLELLEGMAVIKFDSGAEVVLEAPATLNIIDAMNCRLERGTVVADVPPSAIGFTVDTPEAKVVDYGTRFGVSAGDDGKYLVKVLEGLVEVNPKDAAAGKARRLTQGQSMDTGLRRNQLAPATSSEQESHRWQPNRIFDGGDGWQVISTAYGRGKDSYIQSETKKRNFGRDPFFRVKHSGIVSNLDRKGYVGFDLEKFDKKAIQDAELVLSIEPSDLGFASLVPDSTFSIYGLVDEKEDHWNEMQIEWQDAPGHLPDQPELNKPDMTKVVKLGEIQVAQGSLGSRVLHNKALVDFLQEDTNGLVTFIICRETAEMDRDGLVHAFATKESRNNTPPLLRLKMD